MGELPEKLVWDREAAIAAGGRPTEPFASFCGQLEVRWVILEPRDPQAKELVSLAGVSLSEQETQSERPLDQPVAAFACRADPDTCADRSWPGADGAAIV